MATHTTSKIIGNYIVEKGDKILMIRDMEGTLLKAEVVKAWEEEDRFNDLCEKLGQLIKDRVAAGKWV
jgi:hypothetical protein